MDDTQPGNNDPEAAIGEALERLREADPADAPEIAEWLAGQLGDDLDRRRPDGSVAERPPEQLRAPIPDE